MKRKNEEGKNNGHLLFQMWNNGALLGMRDLLEKELHLIAEGEQWNYLDATAANYWTVGMIGTLYSHAPSRFAPAVAALLEHADIFQLVSLLQVLDEFHHIRQQPMPHEVRTALFTRLFRLQDTMVITPTQLLKTCAHLIPDTLVQQSWDQVWNTWPPETRASFAEVLSQGTYTSESAGKQARQHLLQLLLDAQYKVRREACHSLATLAPEILFQVCITWTYTPILQLRQRAAEILAWLPPKPESWQIPINRLYQQLARDPDPEVRETTARAITERRQHTWARHYLAYISSIYEKTNQDQLTVWRYGHALTLLGDEITLAELETDLRDPQRPLHQRQWLRWIFSNTQEHWKKAMEQWPKPWHTGHGEVIYEQTDIVLGPHLIRQGLCCLYQPHTLHAPHEQAHWGGAFWLNTPTPISVGESLTLTLSDGRSGKARIIASIEDKGWLLEGIDRLTVRYLI